MNKVLMVALDFPPCKSAGVQRTLKFCEHLPGYGWTPFVLSAMPLIYNHLDTNLSLPDWLEKNTYRSFGFNAFKHFSINGKYFGATALPDAYATWFYHSKYVGKNILKQHKPDIIWSTYPYITSHRIAAYLQKYSDLPWIADYRDPFRGHDKKGKAIDAYTVNNADLVVFATANMAEIYKQRYPDVNHKKFIVIENGYNEDAFKYKLNAPSSIKTAFTLLHSGELYSEGRTSESLLRGLKLYNNYKQSDINIIFRGASLSDSYSDLIDDLNIGANVSFLPGVSYAESINEMMHADALIVIQGEIFNSQIPGKVYEYLRAEKPILAIVDPEGATANLLKDVRHAVIVDINDAKKISEGLLQVQNITKDDNFDYQIYDRVNGSKELVACMDRLVKNV